MSPAEAVNAPRLHHAWYPDQIKAEAGLFNEHPESVERLRQMGHVIRPRGTRQGDAHTIWIDPATGLRHGIADLRRRGAAKGD